MATDGNHIDGSLADRIEAHARTVRGVVRQDHPNIQQLQKADSAISYILWLIDREV